MTEKKDDMALLDWDDEISPVSTEKQSYLEQQRIAWQSLEEGKKKFYCCRGKNWITLRALKFLRLWI